MTNTKPAIQISNKQMSEALYNYLCDGQVGEHAYGEDAEGNSVEITWSQSHQEFQIINRYHNNTDIYYDHFCENYWEDENPDLLRDMCERLGLIDEIIEKLEEDDEDTATYEWFMTLDENERTTFLSAVKQHTNQTDEQIIKNLPKEVAV